MGRNPIKHWLHPTEGFNMRNSATLDIAFKTFQDDLVIINDSHLNILQLIFVYFCHIYAPRIP